MKKKIVSMLCLPLTLSLLFAGCGKESAKERFFCLLLILRFE